MLEKMRLELAAEGLDVNIVAINKNDAGDDVAALAEQCRFPVLQDTPSVQAWAAFNGIKDDLYVYRADGTLSVYLSPAGTVETNLSKPDGYAAVKAAIVAAGQ